MSTPSITPAQIKAVILTVIGLLAAFGLPVGQEKQDAILKVVEILPVVLVAADALIRFGRSRALSNPEAIRELESVKAPYVNR